MERTNSGLSVSAKGKQLLDLVNPSLVTPELTEKWESRSKQSLRVNKSQLFLKDIEEDTKKLVREIKQSEKNIKIFPLRKNVQIVAQTYGKKYERWEDLRLYKPRMFLSSAKRS